MTTIELTGEQQQALQAEQGKLVDVVDPATKRHYVLLAQEQYERVRSLLEATPEPPAPFTGGETAGGKPLRQSLRDLPLPPEVAEELNRYCSRLGSRKARNHEMEEQMKLQHYFGGKWVAYLRTKEGPVIVATADRVGDPAFEQQLSSLTTQERQEAIIDCPTRLFDNQSDILTPFTDES
jgi:hypothetical protein